MAVGGLLALVGCGGGGGGTGTGGTTGTAGTTATAGTTGTAGAAGTSAAGTTGTAGTAGTTGGTAGTTGGTTGTAGAAGGTTGSGGGGAGGTTAVGGAGGGTAGSSGTTGAGGRGGAAGGGAGRGGSSGGSSGGAAGGSGGATNCAGNAVSFGANGTGTASDAARSRVMVDLMTDLPIGNSNRTIEYWAYIKTSDWVGESNTMFEYGNQSVTAAGWGMDFGTNAVSGMTGNHATLDPYTNGGFDGDSTNYLGITSTTNQWVHIAMTWDGTTFETYINGAPRIGITATGSTTRLATAQTQLTIGCNNPRFSCFNGYVDEFRVWNVARTATQIMSNYNKTLVGNETGLVLYLKFDEASGAAPSDSVTTAGHTAHNGVLMSANSMPPTSVPSTAPISCP